MVTSTLIYLPCGILQLSGCRAGKVKEWVERRSSSVGGGEVQLRWRQLEQEQLGQQVSKQSILLPHPSPSSFVFPLPSVEQQRKEKHRQRQEKHRQLWQWQHEERKAVAAVKGGEEQRSWWRGGEQRSGTAEKRSRGAEGQRTA
ncbi:unnamed protein product [Closterium sp. NIES-64]|nr:unnamed protein product [Closterium sp. NIES-64]